MSHPGKSDLICRIDASNTLVAAGDGWNQLLHPDALAPTTPPPYLGQRLWTHLSDTTTVHLFEALAAKVRRTGATLSVPFRCDLPGRRLHLEVQLLPQPAGGVEIRSELLREEPRATMPPPRRASDDFLRMCGWCKRIAAPEWVEVEEAIRRLKLLEADEVRRVTHSICRECADKVIREMQG